VRGAAAVHIHEYFYQGSILSFLLAKLHRKPVLLTQHLGRYPTKRVLIRAVQFLLERTAGRLLLRRSDRVVFVSPVVQCYFSERKLLGASNHHVVSNGVDHDRFHPLTPDARARLRGQLGISDEQKAVLFVGRFVPKKGLPFLRSLAETLPEIRWLLFGSGEIEPETWNLPNVSVRRGLPQSELVPWYQAADLLVLPSKGEGFPLVIQEAMACGTPVLVSEEIVAGDDSVRDCIFTAPRGGEDALAAWKKSLSAIFEDPARLAGFRTKVAEFAAAHWSWTATAKAYAAELTACAAQRE
jgi:glycosyltransferase involved in cell wall biosynthesis